MKLILFVLVLLSVTTNRVYGRNNGGKMMKSSSTMMKSSSSKGSSSVDLVDTSAEATALHMSGACGFMPDNDWADACLQSNGVPTRLTIGMNMGMGANRNTISCCPAAAFDVDAIVAYGQSFPRGSGPLCTNGSEAAPYAGVLINDRVWCLPPAVVEQNMRLR